MEGDITLRDCRHTVTWYAGGDPERFIEKLDTAIRTLIGVRETARRAKAILDDAEAKNKKNKTKGAA